MDYSTIKSYFHIKDEHTDTCKAVCPCHKDKEASLSISHKQDKTLLTCHAGCTTRDILEKVGLKMSDLWDQPLQGKSNSFNNIAAVYQYKDENGKVLFEKVRFIPKKFTQRRIIDSATVWGLEGGTFYETFPDSNNWSKKKRDNAAKTEFPQQDPVIYRLPEVINAVKNKETIVIVEGEKDVDALINLGFTATCNFDGASKSVQKQKWRENYNPYFKGANIVLIPDCDNPGRAHMRFIAESLKDYTASIKMIEFQGMPDKSDTSDWLEEGHTKEELLELIEGTENYIFEDKKNIETSIINFNFSDVGNAERLVSIHGRNIRYSPIRGKWLIWSGRHWQIDETGNIERLARDIIKRLQQEGNSIESIEQEDLKKQINKFVLRSEGDGRIKAMINQAKTQNGIVMQSTDKDIYFINLKNGTLDLKNGQFKKHERKDNITKLINVEYDPAATCENWEKFLDRIFMEDKELIEYMQKTVGYSLTGDISQQCFYMLYGDGANGKSTFLNTIQEIMSDYTDTLKGSSLMTKYNDDGARGDLAKLQGKRFVIASELNEGQTFDESLIKAITGGDIIPVRYLYGEEFPLKAQFKIWIGTNEKPRIKGSNHGIWRRMRIIPFLYKFSDEEKNENFYEEFIKPELPGILNWAIKGCMKWQREGITTPEKVLLQVEEYRTEMDSIQRFIDDYCVVDDKCSVNLEQLYEAYTKWCTETKEYELSYMKFNKKVKEKNYEQKRNSTRRFWTGIGLSDKVHSQDITEVTDNVYPFKQTKMDMNK